MDCDPGHDDAIALILAVGSRQIELLGVTTTAGNQTIEKTTANAGKILSFLGVQPPLASGAVKPLVRDLMVAPSVHGASGMDGAELPAPSFVPEEIPAWELTRKILLSENGPVTLVATGPLTNIALLLTCYPAIRQKINNLCIMGGGLDHGNRRATAEFNILVDPEAADIVFSSGIPITLCPLDVTEKAFIVPEEIDKLKNRGKVSQLIARLLTSYFQFYSSIGYPGCPLHDPCTIAYLIDPSLFSTEEYHVVIETEGKHTTGMTVADKRPYGMGEKPNVSVCVDIDRDRFVSLLFDVSAALDRGETV